jgi:hypothetical protein
MFQNFSNSLASVNAKSADAAKAMSPMLRSDIYTAIDKTKAWIIGGMGSGLAGDGVSFGPIVSIIQRHVPDTKVGLELMTQVESEMAVVVGGVTNMILTMSKWDGMAGGMAMRTWVDTLVETYTQVPNDSGGRTKESIAKGITRGINQNTDVTLMTREFAARIQIISLLKTGTFRSHLFFSR